MSPPIAQRNITNKLDEELERLKGIKNAEYYMRMLFFGDRIDQAVVDNYNRLEEKYVKLTNWDKR